MKGRQCNRLICIVMALLFAVQLIPAQVFASFAGGESVAIPGEFAVREEYVPATGVQASKSTVRYLVNGEICESFDGTIKNAAIVINEERQNSAQMNTSPELGVLPELSASANVGSLAPGGSVSVNSSSASDTEVPESSVTELGYKVYGAPFKYEQNTAENVSVNTGALLYQHEDILLPGKNGLDLSITRRYDSSEAHAYNPAYVMQPVAHLAFYVEWGTEFVYIAPETREETFIGLVEGPYYEHYDVIEAAEAFAEEKLSSNDNNATGYVVRTYVEDPTEYISGYDYIEVDYTTLNNHNESIYGLGLGWSLGFSSMEKIELGDDYAFVLHLADGRTLEAMSDLSLSGYGAEEFTLASATGLSNGSYVLTYKDGKQEYFDSNGRIIKIEDRYGNAISFVHTTQNGYPKITITDTVGRVVVIFSSALVNGERTVSVSVSGEILAQYVVRDVEGMQDASYLAEYRDAMNTQTAYSYLAAVAEFNPYCEVTLGESENESDYLNPTVLLEKISHPTGAESIFNYESLTVPLYGWDYYGEMQQYRITSRFDKESTDSTVLKNHRTYTYPVAYYELEQLVDSPVNYQTVVSDGELTHTYTFNSSHLCTETVMKAGDVLLSKTETSYTDKKLPSVQTNYVYNQADPSVFMKTSVKYTYDGKNNVTGAWTARAEGNYRSAEHKVSYTYDAKYSIPLTTEYKKDATTTVRVVNTLSDDKKQIVREQVYENNVLKSQVDYGYDSFGNVTSMWTYKDGFSDYTEIVYTYQNGAYLQSERVSGVFDSDGLPAEGTPGYEDGTLVSSYTYDSLGRVTAATDTRGNVTRYTYNAKGDITGIINPDNTSVSYAYDYVANHVTLTDENGNAIRYTYTPLGLEQKAVDMASGSVMSSKEYDSLGRVIRVHDNVYGSKTEYTYDAQGRVLSETVKDGETVLSRIGYTYEDAVNGQYSKVTKTVYGEAGAPTSQSFECRDKYGNVISAGAFDGTSELATTYVYDYLGNCISERSPYAASAGLEYSVSTVYDALGRATRVYNALGQYTAVEYDTFGNAVRTTDYKGTVTTYGYDELGRNITVTVRSDANTAVTSKTYYDQMGNVIRTQIPKGEGGEYCAVTEYEYDGRGRPLYVIAYNGGAVDSVTRYSYDGVGNMTSMTTGLSSKIANDGAVTTYTYDRFGNVLCVTDAQGQSEYYTYSTLGVLLGKTDRNGNNTAYSYDALGRVTSVQASSDAGVDTKSYTYYANGLTKTESNGSFTSSYTYDSLGRVSTVSESGNVTKQYAYDVGGNRTSFVLTQNGEVIQNAFYTYDSLGRLSTVGEGGEVKASYTYDANGNRASLSYANGVCESYEYDDANRLVSLVNAKGDEILSSFSYTYYADGNQSTKTEQGVGVTSYTYDDLGRLVCETKNGESISYTYDRFSNRTQKTENGKETFYTYDLNNRLLTEQTENESQTQYYYDPSGNMISTVKTYGSQYNASGIEYAIEMGVANGSILCYNGFGELTEQFIGQSTLQYSYNASGLRVGKSADGVQTAFILDGGNVVSEAKNGSVTSYLRGVNLISADAGSGESYYLYNGHGDVISLTDALGTVTRSYGYDAFGVEVEPDEEDENPFRYCGEYYDTETGTYYLRARSYDPTIGRFTAEDTHWGPANAFFGDEPRQIGEYKDALGTSVYTYAPDIMAIRQSGNLYVYCAGNPVMFADYTGENAAVIGYAGYSFLSLAGVLPSLSSAITGALVSIKSAFVTSFMPALALVACTVAVGLISYAICSFVEHMVDADKAKAWVQAQLTRSDKLDANQCHDYTVYVIYPNGTSEVCYVGITNNFKRRRYEHQESSKGQYQKSEYTMTPVITGLTKEAARAWEQSLITAYTLDALKNAINSIAQANLPKFKDSIDRVNSLLNAAFTD